MDDLYIPFTDLRIAIIRQAMEDYKKSFEFPCGIAPSRGFSRRECVKFFRSRWCGLLSGGVPGEKIIETAKMEMKYEKWRKETGCVACKKHGCIHKSGKHYTAVEEKNGLSCPKSEVKNRNRKKNM